MKLTPRERQVAKMHRIGARRKEIASALGIATRTVDTYVARIKLKTHGRLPKAA